VTPAPLQPGTVQVRLIRPIDATLEIAKSHLSPAERKRADAFRFAAHADLWTRYRASLRRILAAHLGCEAHEAPLATGDYGKPYIPGSPLHFNLSHDDQFAVVALSLDGPVGIDLERLSRAAELSACADTFCHPAEIAARPSASELLRIWTAKEAFVKARGTGFMTPPEKIRITADAALDEDGHAWPLHRLQHPALDHHVAHLCALPPLGSVVILDVPVWPESTAATEH